MTTIADYLDHADDVDILTRLRDKILRAVSSCDDPAPLTRMLDELERTSPSRERVAAESSIGTTEFVAAMVELVDKLDAMDDPC